MKRRFATVPAVLAVSAALLTACGGGGGGGGGGDFCSNAQNAANQLAGLSKSFSGASASQTPSVSGIKQLMSAATQAFDSLDSSAPSAIAADFHTVRQALDQANSNVQNATSLDQLGTALGPLNAQNVQTASTNVTNYMTNTCHITPAPT
ncbi:MAG: hypothetical protein JOY80_00240 [Candidatus Dormibacteraeota bacterium]|nr:hypothetical protein [Candidatus Dormibacteraeota bacterium]